MGAIFIFRSLSEFPWPVSMLNVSNRLQRGKHIELYVLEWVCYKVNCDLGKSQPKGDNFLYEDFFIQ